MKKLILLLSVFVFSMSIFAYTPSPANFHKYSISHKRSTLPSLYDSRELGIIFPARDQGQTGTCWAFTACEAIRTLYHKNNLECKQLAPIVYVNCAKELGFTGVSLSSGGNEEIVAAMNARLLTPVYQENVPEITNWDNECPSYEYKDIHGYVMGTHLLPEDDRIAIKEAIMKYGSVFSSMMYEEKYLDSKNFYEYIGEEPQNHAVNIIGWDDSKKAWIVKNSWGTSYGDNGIFWVSYNDSYISKRVVAFDQIVDKQDIDEVYGYSNTGATRYYGFIKNIPSTIMIAYDIEEGESIEYISTFILHPNTKLNVLVRANDDNNTILYNSNEFVVENVGIHLHKLKNPVVSSGDSLLVEICYTSQYDKSIPAEFQETYNKITLHDNQWIFDGRYWIPVGAEATEEKNKCNFVVYVYTKRTATDIEETEPNKEGSLLIGGEIDPNVWDYAIRANIFDISGRNFGTIKPGDSMPDLNPGYYVLVLDKEDGGFVVEKFNVF